MVKKRTSRKKSLVKDLDPTTREWRIFKRQVTLSAKLEE